MAKRFGKIAIATTTLALATLVSVDWSEQGGVSLSVESAQARIGRPLTPLSVAGVGRRQYRRAAYGYGYGPVRSASDWRPAPLPLHGRRDFPLGLWLSIHGLRQRTTLWRAGWLLRQQHMGQPRMHAAPAL